MSLKYVNNKKDLPTNSDFECPICLENIDIDEIVNGVPNCVICMNGHRMHNICFKQMTNPMCPTCRTTDIKFCKSKLGYGYVERKGGKKRKTRKKRKARKKRKTKKNSYF